jgi:hypothetical protein
MFFLYRLNLSSRASHHHLNRPTKCFYCYFLEIVSGEERHAFLLSIEVEWIQSPNPDAREYQTLNFFDDWFACSKFCPDHQCLWQQDRLPANQFPIALSVNPAAICGETVASMDLAMAAALPGSICLIRLSGSSVWQLARQKIIIEAKAKWIIISPE